MVVDQIRISVLITRKVNTENSVDMIFGSIVDGAAVLSSDTRFLDSVRIYGREFVSLSFSAPVVTGFAGHDSAFITTQGTGKSGTLSRRFSDKQLM